MRVLIASTQYPYYGGGGTNSYKMTSFLREKGYNVSCIYYENDKANYNDVDNIGGVYFINKNLDNINDIKSNIINYIGGTPDIILASNYVAPVLSKKLFNNSYVVYLSIGSPLFTLGEECLVNKNISAQSFLNNSSELLDFNKNIKKQELLAMEIADIILPNSLILYNMLNVFYPEYTTKIHKHIDYTYFTIKTDKNNSNENFLKTNDIIIVSSEWNRNVKNGEFVNKILQSNKLETYSKIIVGGNNTKFNAIKNCECLGSITNDDVLLNLKKSKLLIIPSLFDANPNVLREALYSKCLVLLSKNVGYSEKLDSKFVMDDVYDTDAWIEQAIYLINNYENNSNNFKLRFDNPEEEFELFLHKR